MHADPHAYTVSALQTEPWPQPSGYSFLCEGPGRQASTRLFTHPIVCFSSTVYVLLFKVVDQTRKTEAVPVQDFALGDAREVLVECLHQKPMRLISGPLNVSSQVVLPGNSSSFLTPAGSNSKQISRHQTKTQGSFL